MNIGSLSENILEIKDLTVHYKVEEEVIEAVNHVYLSLKRGRTLGLVGETGAGKTTTALAIQRLILSPPGIIKSGTVDICGNKMMELSAKALESIRGSVVSMIFQDPMTALNPVFTVGEQIAESYMLHEGLPKKEAVEKAMKMLETVGIPTNRASEYPHQFSGGMKQRVVIAIALTCNPQLLIADEPTTALDVTIQAQVLDLMRKLKEERGMSMIMITHALGIVADICDDVAVMYAGRIVEKGTLVDIFNHTKHPYTEGLFNSLPNIRNRSMRLISIPGLMPDPAHLPEGCAFAPRCRYAGPECTAAQPEERWITDSHMVACEAYGRIGFHIERPEK
jgi:peptide/nickel transport system ATP-binding protein